MSFIKSSANENETINIYYEDNGKGKNVVFIHGWPLSGSMWEYQVTSLINNGIRCITYDRRGFGKSDYPSTGYDYDTLAGDLKALIEELDLQDVTLVGFSMGGGEIAKYFSLFGGARVSKVVLISSVLPFMLQTTSNPDGLSQEAFDKMASAIKDDRPTFLESFNIDFYGVGLINKPVTAAYLANANNKAMESSPIATIECAKSFVLTDFREDVLKINVPTLIIHGSADKIVPIEATSSESSKLISGAKYFIYDNAPHGLWYTNKEALNNDLLDFI